MSASESAEISIARGRIQSEKDVRCFSLAEIQLATNNFNDGLVIGIGGFGKVYKGLIDDGATTVAIKRLNQEAKQGAEEFWTEVNLLSKLRHTNLVSLIGQYNDGQEMILVYEYISHGTLAEHLHKRRKKQRDTSTTSISQYLTWEQRLIICIGAARGLDYLHNLGIIHRDVKTTNILLDENWGAKISDFGLSKITKTHSITHVTTNVKGTFGYLDPDYFLTNRLTKKSDVYAFGVVLFEVLCGRPALDRKLEEDQISLARWAQECNKKGKLDQIIDPSLSGEIAPQCLRSFVKVANNCLRPSSKERPTMATVVHRLELALASQRKGSGTNGIIDKFFQLGMNRYWKKDSNTSTGTSNYGGAAPITVAPPSGTIETLPAPIAVAPPSGTIETLPMFRDVSVPERQNLFVRKVQICCFQFDFSDFLKMVRQKEIKWQCLVELVDFVQSRSGIITESNQEEMVRMISVNIFRCLPPAYHENTGLEYVNLKDEEAVELEPYLEPGWHHLLLVYELLLRYVASSNTDTKVAKRYIDHSFVLKLLELFDSENPRERECLKTILHRIYEKFTVHRPFIRKAINYIFYRFIYETERHSGLGELLEVLGCIINGFALPIKKEHKLFLVRALIPLHKPRSIALYHQQLSFCITQFLEKDYKLADTVIRGLLKYWPVTNCQKEVLFIGELQEVLEATQAAEFQRCMVPLFRQIACCLKSPHFQVAERALSLWKNEHIVNLIAQNLSVVVPIVFEALEKNIQTHWNQAVRGLTVNVRKMFIDMDIELFEECRRQYEEKEAGAQEREQWRELTWQRLDAAAAHGG